MQTVLSRFCLCAASIVAIFLVGLQPISLFAQDGAPGEPDLPAAFVGAWPVEGATTTAEVQVAPLPPVSIDSSRLARPVVAGVGVARPSIVLNHAPPEETHSPGPSVSDVAPASAAEVDVIGGEDAKRGEVPWQAVVLVGGDFYCGGTLIHPRWVMTAAHCVSDGYFDYLPASLITVRLGVHNRFQPDLTTEQERRVIQVLVPSGHLHRSVDYDVALLQLEHPVDVGISAWPIALARSPEDDDKLQPGDPATIAGWGLTIPATGSSRPDILRKAELPIVNQQLCASIMSPLAPVTDRMICAGLNKGRRGGCHGDSGGPLFFLDEQGRARQAGVVSWGNYFCSTVPWPYTVFARVSAFSPWIEHIVSGAGASSEIINPGLEEGSNVGWIDGSDHFTTNIHSLSSLPLTPAAGQWAAWLGGANDEDGYIYAPFTPGSRAREFQFSYFVESEEVDCGADWAYPFVAAYAPGSTGPELRFVRYKAIGLCDGNEESAWRRGAVSLQGFEGKMKMYFGIEVVTNGTFTSSFFVDDFAIVDEALPPLKILDIAPDDGIIGTQVTVKGSGFLNASQVLFGDEPALYVVDSDTTLRAWAPYDVADAPIRVLAAFGETASATPFRALPASSLNQQTMIPVSLR